MKLICTNRTHLSVEFPQFQRWHKALPAQFCSTFHSSRKNRSNETHLGEQNYVQPKCIFGSSRGKAPKTPKNGRYRYLHTVLQLEYCSGHETRPLLRGFVV